VNEPFDAQKIFDGIIYGPLPQPQFLDDVQLIDGATFSITMGYRPVRLDLYSPKDWDGEARPCIVYIHGGAFAFGTRKSWPPFMTGQDGFRKLARAGFNVAAIEYRFSGEAIWPAQLHDVLDAIRWLQDRASDIGIDPAKIALWGESAGGHLVAISGLRFNQNPGKYHPVAEVVDWYGPTDFNQMDAQAPANSPMPHDAPDSPESKLIGAPIQSVPELVADANPCKFVTDNAPAFHIRHGVDDVLVPIGQSEILIEQLNKHNIPVDFKSVPGGHVFDGHPDPMSIFQEGIDYLKQKFGVS